MKATTFCLVLLWCIVQCFLWSSPTNFWTMLPASVSKNITSRYFDDKLRLVYLDELGTKLLKCSIEKRNYYDSDGEFNKEVITKEITKWLELLLKKKGMDYEEQAEKMYQKCKQGKDDDQVERIKN
ncbi:uncharacterized protein LOC116162663 [Photinus pyralis]|uniref:uncharacterized protein LOC116162663 n=1 Tax=Photinus pyralis TaxID=7054 RepID=UPI001267480C|nr:uncharacterized protein LOC116162663 [Photinus pyralis]